MNPMISYSMPPHASRPGLFRHVAGLVLLSLALALPGCASAPASKPVASSPPPPKTQPAPPSAPVAQPAPAPVPPAAPKPAPAPEDTRAPAAKNGGGGTAKQNYVEVEVFYATDRARTGKPLPAQYFGSKRGKLQFGLCSVSIPKRHTRGELESPVWWKLEFSKDPAKHVVLLSRTSLEQAAFYNRLRATADARDLLVFVHGFNVTFEVAVRRTAQIAHDLRFPGVPITYSWPSQGSAKPLDYTADEATVEWTEPHLKQFLKDLRARAGSGRVHLIAHSMGNRALTKVLRSLAAESPPVVFNQVILAAPDIDAEVFERDIAPAMLKAAQRVTLYASSDDEALAVSKTVHGYARAGQSGDQLTLVSGLDTVDASGIDTSLLGHSYFANQLVEDLYALLRNGLPPAERRLDPREKQGLRYWVLPK